MFGSVSVNDRVQLGNICTNQICIKNAFFSCFVALLRQLAKLIAPKFQVLFNILGCFCVENADTWRPLRRWNGSSRTEVRSMMRIDRMSAREEVEFHFVFSSRVFAQRS